MAAKHTTLDHVQLIENDRDVQRHLWRGHALYIRSLFEAQRHVVEPRQQRVRGKIGVLSDNGMYS